MITLKHGIVVQGPKPITIVGVSDYAAWDTERVMILTGKRRVPDTLFYSAYVPGPGANDYLLSVQGLYKGHYADGVVGALDLIKAMEPIAPKSAKVLAALLQRWIARS